MINDLIITGEFNPIQTAVIQRALNLLASSGGHVRFRVSPGISEDGDSFIAPFIDRFNMVYMSIWGIQGLSLLGPDLEDTQANIEKVLSECDLNCCLMTADEIQRCMKSNTETNVIAKGVLTYVKAHSLYGAPDHPWVLRLRSQISPHRLAHTLSVAQTAVFLAALYGENPHKAHQAALLHDCAKGMDVSSMRTLIRAEGLEVDEEEMSMPALLHAPAGSIIARQLYGITDEQVLSAIRWHTTGKYGMTLLEKIIYIADMIEPKREPFDGLDDLREMAKRDLNTACRMAAASSVEYVLKQGKKLHHRTMELAQQTLTKQEGIL